MSGNCATGMRSMAMRARQGDDDGDDHGEPRPADEDGGDHRPCAGRAVPAGGWTGAAAGPGETAWPGRTRWMPSTITLSPSVRPLGDDGEGRRRLAELDPALLAPCCPCRRRRRSRLPGRPARRRAARPAPRSARHPEDRRHQLAVDQRARRRPGRGLGMTPRRIMVSVLPVTELSTKSSAPGLVVQAAVGQADADDAGRSVLLAAARAAARSRCASAPGRRRTSDPG